jgi:DnaJ family protein C protein 28
LQKYFTILEISSHCDQEQVRQAFLNMVKRFHPDSGSPEANAEKFHLVRSSLIFKKKLKEKQIIIIIIIY